MKKLLLLLSLPLVLFGCSKDRNYDGQFTISDIYLGVEAYIIRFGEPIFNFLVKTGIFNFLELDVSSPTNSVLEFISLITFFVILLFIWFFGGFIIEGIIAGVKGTAEDWQKAKKEFQQEDQVGIFKKILRWMKRFGSITWGWIVGIAIIWVFVFGVIALLT